MYRRLLRTVVKRSLPPVVKTAARTLRKPVEESRLVWGGVVRWWTGTRSLALAVVEIKKKNWVWEEFGKGTQEFIFFKGP